MSKRGTGHLRGTGTSEKNVPVPVRVVHALVAGLLIVCLTTGLEAFDFSSTPRFGTRDGLFAVHRAAGLAMALLVIAWLWLRRDHFRRSWVGRSHALLLSVALVTALAPWLARSLGGRFEEAYSLLPGYNLVSQPESGLAYLLLWWHPSLVVGLGVLMAVHAAAALFHAIVSRDKRLSRMFSWDTAP